MVGSIFHPPGSARTISGIFLWYEFPANKGGWTISYLPPTELRGTSIPTTIFNIRHPSLYRGTQACTDMICENGLTFNSVGKAVIEPVGFFVAEIFRKNCGFPCHNGGWLGTSKKKTGLVWGWLLVELFPWILVMTRMLSTTLAGGMKQNDLNWRFLNIGNGAIKVNRASHTGYV